MYEAPPCERAAVKVSQRQVEENVYLGNVLCCSWDHDITCINSHANLKYCYAAFLRTLTQACYCTEAGGSSTHIRQICGNNSLFSYTVGLLKKNVTPF